MLQPLNGLLNVLKPPGMTSHDVVAWVRRRVGGKVGHTGTLDPLAAGVLVLTLGAATRLTDLLAVEDKSYRAELILGLETDTLDLEGREVARRSAAEVTREQVAAALAELTGPVTMRPPAYSAIKQGGRKLYELAREGEDVTAPPREVTISRFELLEFTPGEHARCLCAVDCSKGTYVRSLAQMVGERLGCGACLGFLLRTAQGPHTVADANTLEEAAALASAGRLEEALVPLARALPEGRTVEVCEADAAALRHGQAAGVGAGGDGGMVLVVCGGEAVCLAEMIEQSGRVVLRPKRVFG